MAALIKQATGIDAGVEPGAVGEFSIWLNDRKVAEKSLKGFPSDDAIVKAVSG